MASMVIGMDFNALVTMANAMDLDVPWLADSFPVIEHYITCYHNGTIMAPEDSPEA